MKGGRRGGKIDERGEVKAVVAGSEKGWRGGSMGMGGGRKGAGRRGGIW